MTYNRFLSSGKALICSLILIAMNSHANETPPNILLLIGDDIGVEALKSYGIGSAPANTPVLDKLAREGLQFNNVWSQATCTPTRSTIMTGRFGFRTGVGTAAGGPTVSGTLPETLPVPVGSPVVHIEGNIRNIRSLSTPWSIHAARERGERSQMIRSGLPANEVSIATRLKQLMPVYKTAAIGKWHLADQDNGWLKHPEQAGFDYYSIIHGKSTHYFSWLENVNGVVEPRQGYTPDDKVKTALKWINNTGDQPWFLWYGFNLPHTPFFIPPGIETSLKPEAATTTAELKNFPEYFDLLVEEMDRKIGDILAGIPKSARDNTVVIFVGDNGTTYEAIDAPFKIDQSKFTLFQGGINVPLIISGPGIEKGAEVSALVNTTDLFSTVLDLATRGRSSVSISQPEDSVSLYPYMSQPQHRPLREWAYADRLLSNLGISMGDFSVRNQRYKLIGSQTWNEFYDLVEDPYESNNLLAGKLSTAQKQALTTLGEVVSELHASEGIRSPGNLGIAAIHKP